MKLEPDRFQRLKYSEPAYQPWSLAVLGTLNYSRRRTCSYSVGGEPKPRNASYTKFRITPDAPQAGL